jgi:hypothetical protein
MKPTNLIILGIFVATLPNTAPKLTAYKLVFDIFVPPFKYQNNLKCSYENLKSNLRILDIYAMKQKHTNDITARADQNRLGLFKLE